MLDATNLVVRFYPIPNSASKTVVYFHGMPSKGQVRDFILKSEPIVDDRRCRFKQGEAFNVLTCWA